MCLADTLQNDNRSSAHSQTVCLLSTSLMNTAEKDRVKQAAIYCVMQEILQASWSNCP